ncbi:alpha/beta hydrolase [Actinomadura graeca]|uniref:Alpha/beta hydrolase n=1 Tax=Actinomadura graeca TaxID=2750812 RepID=A0ABX8QZ55_9ACTN|nr:alpha/beta hydrolase [Actinomadura graeca]QXJ23464.1 alpha/beta hydrolase [Actinomadura graeca]
MRVLGTALAVAGLAVGGLLVPTEHESGLVRFTHQPVVWTACARESDDDTGRRLDQAGARCAELRVPLDYGDPGGRTLKVAISRLKAADPARRRGVLLTNPGGPGSPGLDFGLDVRTAMRDVADDYDLIGFDPRFMGRSSPLSCGQVSWWLASSGVRRSSFDAAVRTARDVAQGCQEHGDNARLLPHASTSNTARDMDVIRAALDERTLSYYGVSYGADLGAVYTQLFPDTSDRIVIDSSTNPARTQYELGQDAGETQETGLDEWAAWTAGRSAEYGLGDTAERVRANVPRLLERAERDPIKIGGYRVDHRLLSVFLRNMVSQEDNDATLARSVRDLRDAAVGRRVTPNPELAAFLKTFTGPLVSTFVPGVTAVMCADAGWPAGGWPRDRERYWHDNQALRRSQPVFGALNTAISPCAFWKFPPREPATTIGNRVPLLMVQARRDNNTPYSGAQALHQKLTGSRLVTVDLRAHGVYTRGGEGLPVNACADDAVNAYLRTGTLPPKDLNCAK